MLEAGDVLEAGAVELTRIRSKRQQAVLDRSKKV